MPVHNRREITLQCLRSLYRIDAAGHEVSIYIVDDGSTDGTWAAIQRDYPQVNLIKGDGNLWFTEGTNLGIREAMKADPDYVLAINDDSVFDSSFLRQMIETAETYPDSVIGPLLLLWDEPHRLFQTAPVWSVRSGGWHHWQQQTVWTVPDQPWEVDIIVGNCVLIPADAIRRCGLMDSRRFPNFGDAEYTPRMKKAGYRLILDPRSRVFCQPNAIPQRLRHKRASQLLKELILDLKAPSNLTRAFLGNVRGGPSILQGIAASLFLFGRMALQALKRENAESISRTEPPLLEVFASNVLARK